MRTMQILAAVFFLTLFGVNAQASEVRIKKVLPTFVDLRGKSSLSPSLYERDAYQLILRTHPEQRSGLRFDVQWKGSTKGKHLLLRMELRGVRDDVARVEILEMPLQKNGWFSSWSALTLRDEAYKSFGELSAWRATIWDGSQLLSEQKSFLW